MIKLDFTDEVLVTCTNKMISCLLPHSNFNGKLFSQGLESILKYIKLEEFSLEYRCLLKVLYDMNKIKISIDSFVPRLTREGLDDILQASIIEFVSKNSKDAITWMALNYDEININNPEHVSKCQHVLYKAVIDLYDACYSLEIVTEELAMLIVAYSNAFKANAIAESIKTTYAIYEGAVWLGRKSYKGADGVIEYQSYFTSEIKDRLNNAEEETVAITDANSLSKINRISKMQGKRISDWGIPQLDDATPILRSRLVTIVANPGVGKTLYCSYLTRKLIFSGSKVLYISSESTINRIKDNVSSNNIYKKYGHYVTSAQIAGIEDCIEEAQRLINISDLDIQKTGNLILKENLTYECIYDELKSLYETHNMDVIFIDHIGALKSDGSKNLFTMKQKIDCATEQIRQFKNEYPVCVIVNSHMSTEAQNDLKKFSKVYSQPTAYSGDLERATDELFILYNNETLIASELVGLQVYKRRLKEAPRNHIFLKVTKAVVDYEYSEEYQIGEDKVSKEEALNDIAKSTSNNNFLDEDESLFVDILDDDDD